MPRSTFSVLSVVTACCLLVACGSKEGSQAGSGGPSGAAAGQGPAAQQPTAPAARTDAKPPEAVVKSYLQLGSEGDLSKIKELVDPACHATKVGDVDAVKLMGARMTLTEVIATVEPGEGDTAIAKYTVKGSIDSKGSRTETDIFGKKVDIQVGSMTMTGVSQSGQLKLKKIDGKWVIGC